ncbi:MAG: hypothetical protein ABF811_01975 [Pseudoclavibacter sp.]
MLGFFGDLPWHPLIVHAVVVIGPLTALAAIAYAWAARMWRVRLFWPVLVGAVVTGAAALLADRSGEWLLQRLGQRDPGDRTLATAHGQLGSIAARGSVAFAVGLIVCLFWLLPARREPLSARQIHGVLLLTVRVAVTAASAGLIVVIVLAGHSGTAAVWNGRL